MLSRNVCGESSQPVVTPWPQPLLLYVNDCRQAGLREREICKHVSAVRHFLSWLEADGTRLESVDATVLLRFRHHGCRCVRTVHGHGYKRGAHRSREFMTKVIRFVRFLEESGHLGGPGELNQSFGLLEDFLEQRASEGYTPGTIAEYRSKCRHFVLWLHASRILIKDLEEPVIDRFLVHECLCPGYFLRRPRRSSGSAKRYAAPIRKFMMFLRVQGAVSEPAAVSRQEPSIDLEPYRAWLKQHRGLADSTIRTHMMEAAVLVSALGTDPRRYDAVRIREVMRRRFADGSRHLAKTRAGVMRTYLRFLVSKGACRPSLIAAVPTVANWPLSTLPRYLPPEDIERVIASCDLSKHAGIRDRAILLLLARLGLRAGDVANLRLTDIDWRNASITVCGKSKRAVRLPLPQDAGEALLDYIQRARPKVEEARVFLRARAPNRALSSSSSIGQVVSAAVKRAGVGREGMRTGAYLLRHSAATALLRAGASLDSIGTLLRHRSPNTTAIYAKVDIPMLQQVAQPWIGDVQ